MKFEVGKFYKHNTGICLSILCEAKTTLYGDTYIAEQACGGSGIVTVGKDQSCTANFHEISKEEWMENFS